MNSSVWFDSKETAGPQKLNSDTSGILKVPYWERVAKDIEGTAGKEAYYAGYIT